MIEKLKAKRAIIADELAVVSNEDLLSLIAERVEAYRQKAIEEVNQEHEAKVNAVNQKLEHYDYVIKALEAEEVEVNEEVVEE